MKGFQEPPKNAQTATPSPNSQLEEIEKGYERVLEREPENQFALQKLVEIRIQMNDLPGALAPMEKLVKLNPDNAQYKALLAGIKERVGTAGTAGKKGDQ